MNNDFIYIDNCLVFVQSCYFLLNLFNTLITLFYNNSSVFVVVIFAYFG